MNSSTIALQAKPIHGAPKPVNVPGDMQSTPPVACKFKVGDSVTYTNDYGASFRKVVRGFSPTPRFGRFIYLDLDCWWAPVAENSLRLSK